MRGTITAEMLREALDLMSKVSVGRRYDYTSKIIEAAAKKYLYMLENKDNVSIDSYTIDGVKTGLVYNRDALLSALKDVDVDK